MILERCTQDFRNLIEWLKIKWEYDHTPKPQRPASVAWEIRKTSPGRVSRNHVRYFVWTAGGWSVTL